MTVARPKLCGVCGLPLLADPDGIQACPTCDRIEDWPKVAAVMAEVAAELDDLARRRSRAAHPSNTDTNGATP